MGFRTLPLRSGGDQQPPDPFPFQGIIKNFGTINNPNWKVGVYFDSSVYQTRSLESDFDIKGLLSQSDPKDNDSGWKTTSDGDKIMLEIEFKGNPSASNFLTLVPTAANIKSTKNDGEMKGGEFEYAQYGSGSDTDPTFYALKYARRTIFTVDKDPDNSRNLLVSQCVRNDLFFEYGVGTGLDSGGQNPFTVIIVNLVQN